VFYDILSRGNSFYTSLTQSIKRSIRFSVGFIKNPIYNLPGHGQKVLSAIDTAVNKGNDSGTRKKRETRDISHPGSLSHTYQLAVEKTNSSAMPDIDHFSTPVLICLFCSFIFIGCVLFEFDSTLSTHETSQVNTYATRFYSAFNMLTQISVKTNPTTALDDTASPASSTIYALSYISYMLIGVSFTFTGLRVLRERLRLCILENFKQVFIKLIKFSQHFDTARKIRVPVICINDKAVIDNEQTSFLNSIGRDKPDKAIVSILRAVELEQRENKEMVNKKALSSKGSGQNIARAVETTDKQTQVTTILYTKYMTSDDLSLNGKVPSNLQKNEPTEKKLKSKIFYDMHTQTMTPVDETKNNEALKQVREQPPIASSSLDKTSRVDSSNEEGKETTTGNHRARANLNLSILKTANPTFFQPNNSLSTARTNTASSNLISRRSRFESTTKTS
jgi:hypothetical protein